LAFKFNLVRSSKLTIQEILDKLNKHHEEVTIITDNIIISNDKINEDKKDTDEDKRIKSQSRGKQQLYSY